MGFNRWVKTWIADYSSVEEVYWVVPGNTVDPEKLPSRAFDSPDQREQTTQLLEDYNDAQHVTPELDSRFAVLAAERVIILLCDIMSNSRCCGSPTCGCGHAQKLCHRTRDGGNSTTIPSGWR